MVEDLRPSAACGQNVTNGWEGKCGQPGRTCSGEVKIGGPCTQRTVWPSTYLIILPRLATCLLHQILTIAQSRDEVNEMTSFSLDHSPYKHCKKSRPGGIQGTTMGVRKGGTFSRIVTGSLERMCGQGMAADRASCLTTYVISSHDLCLMRQTRWSPRC